MADPREGLDALIQAAVRLHQSGRLGQAEQAYHEILARDPDDADTLHLLGQVLLAMGRPGEAVEPLVRASHAAPRSTIVKRRLSEAWNGLGVEQASNGRIDEAATSFEAAIAASAENAQAHCNLGLARQGQGRLDEAVLLQRKALALAPDLAEAQVNLGLVLGQLGKPDDARALFEQVLAKDPHSAEAHLNLGSLHERRGDVEAAIASYRQALAERASFPEANNNLGNLLKAGGDLTAAEHCYRTALAAAPDYPPAHMNLGILRLLQGNYTAGWAEYAWRWKALTRLPAPDNTPAWDGGDLAGKSLLLRHEQGLGDTIQFSRFVGAALARGAGRVMLQVPLPLVRLLRAAFDQVSVSGEDEPAPAHDRHAFLIDLPRLLKVTVASIPGAPYLRARDDLAAAWRERLEMLPGLKVGVVWRGNPQHQDDGARSITAERMAGLATIPGISLVSLQKDARGEELRTLGKAFDAAPLCRDFADTAACIAGLDLTISVDTAVVHLAGAMGAPVWILIAATPDWRWLIGRDDSPWYPTMRLFRQASPGDWDGVLDGVRGALAERVGS